MKIKIGAYPSNIEVYYGFGDNNAQTTFSFFASGQDKEKFLNQFMELIGRHVTVTISTDEDLESG